MFVFIHGYGTNIRTVYHVVRKRRRKVQTFDNLHPEMVFDWSEELQVPLKKTVSIRHYLRHYYHERQKSTRDDVHAQLHSYLERKRPKVILCHSLGCELLLQYLQRYQQPSSVKQVVFLHADVSVSSIVEHRKLHDLLQKKQITLTNYYCPWDYVLVISSILHRKIRGGLRRIDAPYIENRLYATRSIIRPHTACLSNRKLLEQLKLLN